MSEFLGLISEKFINYFSGKKEFFCLFDSTCIRENYDAAAKNFHKRNFEDAAKCGV